MTPEETSLPLPPLLDRFRDLRPGDIHSVASKSHLLAGFKSCASNSVNKAAWNKDRTELTVSFGGVHTKMLMLTSQVAGVCNCRAWEPGGNCQHVVVVWAVLKRLASPETLSHIRFDGALLDDMKLYLGLEGEVKQEEPPAKAAPKSAKETLAEALAIRREQVKAKQAKPKPPASPPAKRAPLYRLVIQPDTYYGGVFGRIMRGDEVVPPWAARGLPTELSRFAARNYYYESRRLYFEDFLKITGGKYPIVFLDESGKETELTYQDVKPCRAGMVLDLCDGEVLLLRTLEGGRELSAGAVAHGELLFLPGEGSIRPIENLRAWTLCNEIIERIESVDDCWESEELDDEAFFDDDDVDDDALFDREESELTLEGRVFPTGVKRLPNGVSVPLLLFNASAISIDFGRLSAGGENVAFLVNGLPAAPSSPAAVSYLVDIPSTLGEGTIPLRPVGLCNGYPFPCSDAVFWLMSPIACRLRLPAPLRAKKRLGPIRQAAFELMEESRKNRRTAIIRQVTASADFSKRQVKRETKRLLDHLHAAWNHDTQLLLATADGWQLAGDKRLSQARLMKLLYDSFADAFLDDPDFPGGIALPAPLFRQELARLVSRLEEGGFSLRVGGVPLEKATWEFALDATRSGLDWFELHPEIRCDGELLCVEEMQGLFQGRGILERNGRVVLLDEATAQVLAMLAGSLPARKRKGDKKGEAVRVPRLQILDWLELRKHGVSVKLLPQDARVLESLLDFSAIPPRPLPSGLDATLRHYQSDAYRWLAFLYEHRFGACLADDMGLGKTLQGISLMAALMRGDVASAAPGGTPHLVVAPPSLLFNWEAEIARFFPEAKTLLYSGAGRSSDAFGDHDVVITSYGIVQRDIDLLERLRFDVIVFDETQVVKNLKAATTNAVRRLKGFFSLALTGTPLENHLGEYFAIMDLCLPGLLGNREELSRHAGKGDPAAVERLVRRTRPFILRRTKDLIAAELPPKIESEIHLELLPKQKALYQRTVEEVRGEVRDAYAGHAPAQARIIALTAILRLRQICLAPALAAPGASDASPKLDFLADQLLELEAEGHSALVFSQFTGYLDLIEKGLKEHGLSCLRLDGSTPVPRRKELVQSFQQAREPSVFLISLKAGGKGLNLTRASYVYHMDPWWNPAVENQASDRAHRIGQTGQVTITRLIMRHTVEEKMMALKKRKSELYRAILEEGTGSGGAALTREDFEFLLG